MSDQSVTCENSIGVEVISTPIGDMITRRDAGKYLKSRYGFGSRAMLAKLAMDGSGPAFHKSGSTRSHYPVTGLDAWARARLGEERATHKGEVA